MAEETCPTCDRKFRIWSPVDGYEVPDCDDHWHEEDDSAAPKPETREQGEAE